MIDTDLREWSAKEVMEWHLTKGGFWAGTEVQDYPPIIKHEDWQPDIDLNQCFMVVERMRELGWSLNLLNIAKLFEVTDSNPCLAILKAAKATDSPPREPDHQHEKG